jgi:flavin-dependent dehydrogenase
MAHIRTGGQPVRAAESVQITAEYDVLVCGGGTSGIPAAIAAAREGARVAVVERYGFLGGNAVCESAITR